MAATPVLNSVNKWRRLTLALNVIPGYARTGVESDETRLLLGQLDAYLSFEASVDLGGPPGCRDFESSRVDDCSEFIRGERPDNTLDR